MTHHKTLNENLFTYLSLFLVMAPGNLHMLNSGNSKAAHFLFMPTCVIPVLFVKRQDIKILKSLIQAALNTSANKAALG